MNEEFKVIMKDRDSQIAELSKENEKLRILLKFNYNIGKPTDTEIIEEIKRHELSLKFRDENQTQTDIKNYADQKINTIQTISNRPLVINQLESSDEKIDFQESTSNLLLSKHSKSIEQLRKAGVEHKIMTTPLGGKSLTNIKSDNRIFGSLVHGHNKKSAVYSVRKTDDGDSSELEESKVPQHASRNHHKDLMFAPLNVPDEIVDDYPLKSPEGIKVLTPENENKRIHEIFKNSEIIGKSGTKTKDRYTDESDEGEYDFYEAESPQEQAGTYIQKGYLEQSLE